MEAILQQAKQIIREELAEVCILDGAGHWWTNRLCS